MADKRKAVHAIRWIADYDSFPQKPEWLQEAVAAGRIRIVGKGTCMVLTDDGWQMTLVGDWIIRNTRWDWNWIELGFPQRTDVLSVVSDQVFQAAFRAK